MNSFRSSVSQWDANFLIDVSQAEEKHRGVAQLSAWLTIRRVYMPSRRPLTLSPAHRPKALRPAATKNDMSNSDPKSWYSGIVLNRLTSAGSRSGLVGGGGNDVRSCTIVDKRYIPCQGYCHLLLLEHIVRGRVASMYLPSVVRGLAASKTPQDSDLLHAAPDSEREKKSALFSNRITGR